MKALLSSAVLASALLLTACGGGDSDSSSDTTTTGTYVNTFVGSSDEPACKVETGNIIRVPHKVGCGFKNQELTEGNTYIYDCGDNDTVMGSTSVEEDPQPIANRDNGDHVFEGKNGEVILTVTCRAS